MNIGIFDSGVGGLGILKEITRLLPAENIIYFADQAYFPYGEKSYPDLQQRTGKIVDFLLGQNCDLIIIACNTASVAALHYLRSRFPGVAIVGVVPIIKTISLVTLNKRLGILATKTTLASGYLHGLVQEFCPDSLGYKIFYQEAGDLVEKAEKAELYGVEKIIKKYTDQFKKHKVDAIALGSTHLPFFKRAIQKNMGPHVNVSDSNAAVARQVLRIVENNHFIVKNNKAGIIFYTSLDARTFRIKIEKLIGLMQPVVERVELL